LHTWLVILLDDPGSDEKHNECTDEHVTNEHTLAPHVDERNRDEEQDADERELTLLQEAHDISFAALDEGGGRVPFGHKIPGAPKILYPSVFYIFLYH